VQPTSAWQIAGQLFGVELSHCALPRLELGQLVNRRWCLHPLDGLIVGHEVYVGHFLEVVKESLRKNSLRKCRKDIGNNRDSPQRRQNTLAA
jgi:hypothetical protein